MCKIVWVIFILHTCLSLCGRMYGGFLLSSVHLTSLPRQVFFLHSAVLTSSFSPSLDREIVFLEINSWQLYLCPAMSSCVTAAKRKRLELGTLDKRGLLSFQKKGTSLMIRLVLAAAQSHGYHLSQVDFRFACSGQIFLCLLPVLNYDRSSLEQPMLGCWSLLWCIVINIFS